ncbi:MAG: hypothetical protein GEU78_16025 [Actinobacteria bacterium]|nr:hypothetical protein [Actinomycetota bacterium]
MLNIVPILVKRFSQTTPTNRTYADHGDACRAANALDLVGDRWTLIIVRELILGPKRFADLEATVRGITPAVLTARLRSLVDAGIRYALNWCTGRLTSPEFLASFWQSDGRVSYRSFGAFGGVDVARLRTLSNVVGARKI